MNFSTLFFAAFVTIELSKCSRFSLNFSSWSKSDFSCNISLSTIDLIPVLFDEDLAIVVVDLIVVVFVVVVVLKTFRNKLEAIQINLDMIGLFVINLI